MGKEMKEEITPREKMELLINSIKDNTISIERLTIILETHKSSNALDYLLGLKDGEEIKKQLPPSYTRDGQTVVLCGVDILQEEDKVVLFTRDNLTFVAQRVKYGRYERCSIEEWIKRCKSQ